MTKNMVSTSASFESLFRELQGNAVLADQNLLIMGAGSDTSSDLDVLVTNRSKNSPANLVGKSDNPFYSRSTTAYVYWFNETEGRIETIDLYDCFRLKDEAIDVILRYSHQESPNVYIPLPMANAAYQLMKELLVPRYRPDKLTFVKKYLVKESVLFTEIFYELALQQGLVKYEAEEVIKALQAGDLSEGALQLLRRRVVPEGFAVTRNRPYRDKILHYLKRHLYSRGKTEVYTSHMPSVALIGLDGSGKSSAINRFKERHLHLHIGVDAIKKKVLIGPSRRLLSRPLKLAARIAARLQMRFVAKLFSMAAELPFWLVARSVVIKGQDRNSHGVVMLYDRWSYDKIPDFDAVSYPVEYEVYRKLYLDLFPYPDVVLFFDVPPVISSKRRPEESMGDQEEKRKRYIKLVGVLENRGVKVINIDASKSMSAVDSQVARAVYQSIRPR